MAKSSIRQLNFVLKGRRSFKKKETNEVEKKDISARVEGKNPSFKRHIPGPTQGSMTYAGLQRLTGHGLFIPHGMSLPWGCSVLNKFIKILSFE